MFHTHNFRGFTLVELMMVMAVMAILFAALIPAVSGYILRGRDTARLTGLRDLGNGIINYYGDKNDTYPTVPSDCDISTTLTSYFAKPIKDPTLTRNNGCGANGVYGYGTGVSSGKKIFALTAYMENPKWWNWIGTGRTNPFTGNLSSLDMYYLSGQLVKWTWAIFAQLQQ